MVIAAGTPPGRIWSSSRRYLAYALGAYSLIVGVVAIAYVALGLADGGDGRAAAFAMLLFVLPPCIAAVVTVERNLAFRLIAFAGIWYSLALGGFGLVSLLPVALLVAIALFTPHPPETGAATLRRLLVAYGAAALVHVAALAVLAYLPGDTDAEHSATVPVAPSRPSDR